MSQLRSRTMRPRQPPLASAHWAQSCWIRSSPFVVTEMRTVASRWRQRSQRVGLFTAWRLSS